MSKKHSSSKRGLHFSMVAIVLVTILTASVAFPQYWNAAVDKIGFGPRFNTEDFQLGLDLQGGTHLVYEADMSEIPAEDRASALEGVRDVIERRVNVFGVAEPSIVTNVSNGNYRVIIELAGVFDVNEAISLIGETPILEFKLPLEDVDVEPTEEEQQIIDDAQAEERQVALSVLDRALEGEEFDDLVKEFSIDSSTSYNNGYYGYISENDPTFGELALEIDDDRLGTGVIDGLYESDSQMYIVNVLKEGEEEYVEAAHILVCYTGNSQCTSDRSQAEAQQIVEEIWDEVDEDNFADLAMEKSDGPSGPDGGYLGEVTLGMMVEPFENALFAMEDGEITKEFVETEFGYHIIHRIDSYAKPKYEIAYIEMPWTTVSDVKNIDPWENTELSGKHVKSASVAFDPNTNVPYVELNFNAEGGELFGTLTEDNVGEIIGIFLDGTPISTPVVQQAIYGGEATITGSFTIEEAKLLAQRLNAGALPVPIELLSEQTVGPTLGHLSFEQSIQAALIGLVLVALFMLLYYRLPGLLATLALAVYSAVNLALYKWLGVTLTLAGIAGFILSLGMAVDANVLIFERLKEELRSGRDLATAIDEGFRRAWTSIRDGNITTLIAAAVLFSMGTGFVKGFALTLALGIIVSMLTAILVTRMLLKWFTNWKIFRSSWLFNGNKKDTL